jgi:hypothetical protein
MEETKDVSQDSSPEQVAVSEDVNTPPSVPVKAEEKVVPYDRFKEVNDELARLKNQPRNEVKDSSVEALDFIKLGKKLQNYSDEEIDFATEVAKSKSPDAILAALDNEMVQLAISARREKLEKEQLALKPTGTQSDSDAPRSFSERLATASVADKEKILTEAGLYKSPRPRADRVNLGRGK